MLLVHLHSHISWWIIKFEFGTVSFTSKTPGCSFNPCWSQNGCLCADWACADSERSVGTALTFTLHSHMTSGPQQNKLYIYTSLTFIFFLHQANIEHNPDSKHVNIRRDVSPQFVFSFDDKNINSNFFCTIIKNTFPKGVERQRDHKYWKWRWLKQVFGSDSVQMLRSKSFS